jgi:tetratricopeptide (TPR) repeat protein
VGDLVLATLGPTEAAFEVLEQAVALDGKAYKTLIALARAHWQKAEATEGASATTELTAAESYLEQARPLAAADPEVLAVEGHIRRLQAKALRASGAEGVADRIALARKAYRTAIKLDEALAEAYFGLGLTYLIDDNGSEEGQAALEVAAFLLPLEASIALSLGELQVRRGNLLQAVPALQYALLRSKDPATRERTKRAIDKIREVTVSQDAEPAPAVREESPTPK